MLRRNGGARCCSSDSTDASERPGLPMELQSRQMRIVLGRSERYAEADVHGADERPTARSAGQSRADESVSGPQGLNHKRVMELPGEETNQTVQAAPAGCAGWHLADAAGRYRSRSG